MQYTHALECTAAVHSLYIVVVLGHHLHIVCHQVDGVEAHAKLANEVEVAALLHLLQEGCEW